MKTYLFCEAYGEFFTIVCHNDKERLQVENILRREWIRATEACSEGANSIDAQDWLKL